MLSPKSQVFCKRTLCILLPLPVFTFGLRLFSSDTLSTFSLPLGISSEITYGDGSAIGLVNKKIDSDPHIVDRGSLLEIDDLSIEQLNPFNGDFLGYGGDYWYKKAKIKEFNSPESSSSESGEIIFAQDTTSEEKKYTLSLESFRSSDLNGKGDLHLVTEIKITPNNRPVTLMTILPLQDLIYDNNKDHEIFSITKGHHTDQYNLRITKNTDAKLMELRIVKKEEGSRVRRSYNPLNFGSDNIEIQKFYFLFTVNPPLDYSKIFFQIQESDPINENNYSIRKQIHLANWSNRITDSISSSSPKYSLNFKEDSFWSSICRDPYKVGGWIDNDLTAVTKTTEPPKEKKTTTGSRIQKQKDSWKEFKVGVNVKPNQTTQYYWEQINTNPPYVSIPSTDYTTPSPCQGMDDETKELFREFAARGKTLSNEPLGHDRITVFPKIKYFEDLRGSSLSQVSTSIYPKHKVIQSSFRAWGNGIPKTTGNPLADEIHSPLFEESLQTEHSFTLKIDKDVALQQLVEHQKLLNTFGAENKKLNELPHISTLLKLNVPFSYSVYDPLSNYLRKNRILLTLDLDVRNIYNQNSSSKTIFTRDLKNSYGFIGRDHRGIKDGSIAGTPFGINGILEFSSSLSRDLDGNISVDIITKTKGFVNTKNTDCDLRHRVYKWKTSSPKCFESSDSNKYRKHNHIPSFLILTLEKDPSVSSFFVDRSSTITDLRHSNNTASAASASQSPSEEINTLSGFGEKLKSPGEVRKTVLLDKSRDGEVFFYDISAYKNTGAEHSEERNEIYTSWFLSTTYYNQIHYYNPLRNPNFLDLEEVQDLSSIVLMLSGADSLSSTFFRSGHFNTMISLCTSKQKVENSSQDLKQCADGINYQNILEDKRSSDLVEHEGSQSLVLNWSDIKEKTESDPLTINFRTAIQRQFSTETNNKFPALKAKYEKLFKDDAPDTNLGNKGNIPNFSFLAVWYTVELWYDKAAKKLHYATKVRPISHVPEGVGNKNTTLAVGAMGSAGFQIRGMEFIYRKPAG